MSTQILGWVVKAEAKDKNGKTFTKELSRMFSSKAAASAFCALALKSGKWEKVWVADVYGVDSIND